MLYVVKTTYSFDGDTPEKAFESPEEAKAYLQELFLQEIGIDVKENEYETEMEYSAERNYAVIRNYFADGVDTTEFTIEEKET